MKTIKCNGFWWLPQNPEVKLFGQLNYQFGSSPTLELEGILGNPQTEFYDIILGESDQILYSVINCARVNISQSKSAEGDFNKSTYRAIAILKGHHLEKMGNLNLSDIEVSYSHLREWIGHHLVSRSDFEKRENETILTVKKPKSIEIRLEGLTVEIKGTYRNRLGWFSDSLERDVVVRFYSSGMVLTGALELIDSFRNFLEVLLDERILINQIRVGAFSNKYEIIVPTKMKEKTLDDHFRFCPVPVEANLLLDKLEFYLENWFSFTKKYEPLYHLYFGVLREKSYITNTFLNYVQAIEAYHSRKFESSFIKSDLEQVIGELDRVVEKFDFLTPFKKDIHRKFEYINRKSLRMIVKELTNNEDIVSDFIADKKDFVNKVVHARNYYTHYETSKKEENKPIEISEMVKLVENMRFLLTAIILMEIGFERAQIRRSIALYCRDRVTVLYNLDNTPTSTDAQYL